MSSMAVDMCSPEAAAFVLGDRLREHRATCPTCKAGRCEESARISRALRAVPSLLKMYQPTDEDCR